jgi:hypothetical protein
MRAVAGQLCSSWSSIRCGSRQATNHRNQFSARGRFRYETVSERAQSSDEFRRFVNCKEENLRGRGYRGDTG